MMFNKKEMSISELNHEGYYDPTPCKAITNIEVETDKEAQRFKKLLGMIFTLCELSGYHLEERVVLKDVRTGKVWR